MKPLEEMLERNFFVRWFKKNGRTFPWREEGVSTFCLLIAEMLLRQTDAGSVAKIWPELIKKYPHPLLMAEADYKELKAIVQVLGFGDQRTKALKQASLWLCDNHTGEVPSTLDDLIKIPHIGHYTARAILCFGFNKRIEIVDTNIQRFFSRFYELEVKPDTRQNKWLWAIVKQALPRERSKIKQHNYGLLDFTAQVCKAVKPLCNICPLQSKCSLGRKIVLNKNL